MDIDVARTFLEIVKAGSFVRAAERLFVTQTAVSARVQNLEQQLGAKLFERVHDGVRLTSDGKRFLPFANQIVHAWDNAREELAMSFDTEDSISIGGELSLWDPYLLNWLVWMNRCRPHVRIRAEAEVAESLVNKVQRGLLDAAIVYSPEYSPEIQIELLMEEKLVLVTTSSTDILTSEEYIHVGWGGEFLAKHDAAFPGLRDQSRYISFGPLALQYILRVGGSGYFRARAVEQYLEDGRLVRVGDAPEFTYPVYTVYRGAIREPVQQALAELRASLEQLEFGPA